MSDEIEISSIEELIIEVIEAYKKVTKELDKEFKFEVKKHGKQHEQDKMTDREIAVYMFFDKDKALKIGKANIGSKGRFETHHYKCAYRYTKDGRKDQSRLANKIIRDEKFKAQIEDDIPKFIKDNKKERDKNSRLATDMVCDKECEDCIKKFINNNCCDDKKDIEKAKLACTNEYIKYFIVNNFQRINVFLNKKEGRFALNFIEALLQYYFKPKYEGKAQRKKNKK